MTHVSVTSSSMTELSVMPAVYVCSGAVQRLNSVDTAQPASWTQHQRVGNDASGVAAGLSTRWVRPGPLNPNLRSTCPMDHGTHVPGGMVLGQRGLRVAATYRCPGPHCRCKPSSSPFACQATRS